MRTFLSALLFITWLPATAHAQGRVTLGVNVGATVPVTEELTSTLNPDVSLMGSAVFELPRGLGIRAEVGRHELDAGDVDFEFCDELGLRCEGDMRLTHFSAGVQVGGFGDRVWSGQTRTRVSPYGFATVGAYRREQVVLERFAGTFTVTAEAPQPALLELEGTHFGFSFGGGINIRFNEHLGIQGDFRLHSVRLDEVSLGTDAPALGWTHLPTPSLGIWVMF